jgi:hypothetical protein
MIITHACHLVRQDASIQPATAMPRSRQAVTQAGRRPCRQAAMQIGRQAAM